MEDPIAFVEKLSKGEDLGIPPQLKLQEVCEEKQDHAVLFADVISL